MGTVDLIHRPFDPAASPGHKRTGYTVAGQAWYRKSFLLPDSAKDQSVTVRFEGVYMYAEFWLNGYGILGRSLLGVLVTLSVLCRVTPHVCSSIHFHTNIEYYQKSSR